MLGAEGQHLAAARRVLSHYKIEAAEVARMVKGGLKAELGAPVFLDSDDLMDLRTLLEAVRNSDVVVLFQTQRLLERPWCLLEIWTAIEAQLPIACPDHEHDAV
eukprot:SAG22_NODE_2376_length_2642_cov_11.644514_3_plen_104_part_00